METLQLLKKIGANPDSYYYSFEEDKFKPKTSFPNKIVCKLDSIYSVFSLNERSYYPDHQNNGFAKFSYENFENIVYDQAEKFLTNSTP